MTNPFVQSYARLNQRFLHDFLGDQQTFQNNISVTQKIIQKSLILPCVIAQKGWAKNALIVMIYEKEITSSWANFMKKE